jgi:hypothetical protein
MQFLQSYLRKNKMSFLSPLDPVVVFNDNPTELLTPDETNQGNPFNPTNQANQGNAFNPANQANQGNLFNPANRANPSNPLNTLDPTTFSRLQDMMRQRQKLQLLQQQIDLLKDVQPGQKK